MSDITTEFYEFIANVNSVVIGSHIASGKLSEWCNNWRIAMKTAVESVDRRIDELERIIDERKRRYAILDTEAAEMKVRVCELERELAAAKEDLHHNDACKVCVGSLKSPDGCDCECLDCSLDCRCKDCRDENKWEWRGAREGEGK